MVLKQLAIAAAACTAILLPASAAIADTGAAASPIPEVSARPIDPANAVTPARTGRVLDASAKRTLQGQIDAQLRDVPGGMQISPTEVSYSGGKILVAFPLPGERTVSTDPDFRKGAAGTEAQEAIQSVMYQRGCPYGNGIFWRCLFDGNSWEGRMVQYADLGVQNLPTNFYNMAQSAVNTGSAYFAIPWDMKIYTGGGGSGSLVARVDEDEEVPSFGTMNNKAKSIHVFHRF